MRLSIPISPGLSPRRTCGGRPCVRDTRITVQEILGWLASGATQEEILRDYPYLDKDDFKAVFAYAASSRTHARRDCELLRLLMCIINK